jgi:hypothetical protein
MKRMLAVLVLVAASCGGSEQPTTSIVSIPLPSTTTGVSVEPLSECPPVPYTVRRVPTRVNDEPSSPDDLQLDEFTSIGGTRSMFWVDQQGSVAVALIRGTLPPQQWPGERGEVDVAGNRAVVGPFADGKWVAAWFEGDGERCDLYTMVFYPPVEPEEVQLSLASIARSP